MVSSHHDYTPATRRGFVAGVPTATVGGRVSHKQSV